MSLLASPSLTSRTTSRSVGVSDAQPLVGRLAFPAAALRAGDRVLGGHGRALGPAGVKVLLTHRISQCRHRCLISGLMDREADYADAMPDNFCGSEEPRGFVVATVLAGQTGETLQDVGNAEERLDSRRERERVMSIAFGVFWLTVRDRHAPPASRAQLSGAGPPSW
jgi:hypothetical protein